MITEEIAKKLYQANFPMMLYPYEKGDAAYFSRQVFIDPDEERWLVPSLEEIIKAFGTRSFLINRYPINQRRSDTWPLDKEWHACSENDLGVTLHQYGNNAEETAALLWIAVNWKSP